MVLNFDRYVEFVLANGDKKSLPWSDVNYFKSNGYLTELNYLDNDKPKKVSINKRIGQIEEELHFKNFSIFRSHRSYLINIKNMMPYKNYPPNDLLFKGNVSAKLSRRKRLEFHKFFIQGF